MLALSAVLFMLALGAVLFMLALGAVFTMAVVGSRFFGVTRSCRVPPKPFADPVTCAKQDPSRHHRHEPRGGLIQTSLHRHARLTE